MATVAAVERRPGRFEYTGWALVLVLLTPFSYAAGVLSLVFAPLTILILCIPLFLGSTYLLRGMAGLHRSLIGVISGRPIASPYRASTKGQPLLTKVRRHIFDPALWRDILWSMLTISAGLALRCVVLGLFFGGLWGIVLPSIWPALPSDANLDLSGIPIHSQAAAVGFGVPYAAVLLTIWWFVTPALMRANIAIYRAVLSPTQSRAELAERIRTVEHTRQETVDTQAQELRRIERDLHDGAQARLVSLGMSLGLADQMMDRDPAKARELLNEARSASSQALQELRDIVRGIHPPVLADRGLDGAVRALALANPLPTRTDIDIPVRLVAPVESAAYFAIAEAMTNVIKHTDATTCWVDVKYANHALTMTVSDDGSGGADPEKGSGLKGIEQRLAAFDGTLIVSSPVGGPTVVAMYLPCEPAAAGAPHS